MPSQTLSSQSLGGDAINFSYIQNIFNFEKTSPIQNVKKEQYNSSCTHHQLQK